MLKGSAEVAVTENRKHKHKQERKKKKINQNCFIYAFFIQDKIPTRWVLLIKKYAKSNRSLSIRFFTAISNNSRPDTQSTPFNNNKEIDLLLLFYRNNHHKNSNKSSP